MFSALSSARLSVMTPEIRVEQRDVERGALRLRSARSLRAGGGSLLARGAGRLDGLGQRGARLVRRGPSGVGAGLGGWLPGDDRSPVMKPVLRLEAAYRPPAACGQVPLARIAVAEMAVCGAGRKIQAGGSLRGQHRRRPRRPPRGTERARGLARERRVVIPRSRQHRDRQRAGDVAPAAPARQVDQSVGAHQPDEAHAREPSAQGAERVAREAGPQHALDVGRDDAAAVGDGPGAGETVGQRRHAVGGLQGIAGRDQQPDLVEPQARARHARDLQMTLVRRVERPPQQPDPDPSTMAPGGKPRSGPKAGPWRGPGAEPLACHALTCPCR